MLTQVLVGIGSSLLVAALLAWFGQWRWASVVRSWMRSIPRRARLGWISPPLVVFVSSGGTCRDPIAKAIAEHLVQTSAPGLRRVRFEARALHATPSKPKPSHGAQVAVRKLLGSDALKAHTPLRISKRDIRRADLILVMSRDLMQKDLLPPEKTSLFKSFFGSTGDIEDPWPDGRDAETIERYYKTAKDIEETMVGGLDRLADSLHLNDKPPNKSFHPTAPFGRGG